MKYLVLGSTSFAGSSFINYLLSQDEPVIGISRSLEPHPIMQPYGTHTKKSAFKFFQLDLNNNLDAIIQVIQQYKPANIVDFAGQGMVAESWSDPAQWYLTNIISKVKLHQVLKHCDFLERYIRISTPEVYGNTPEAVVEQAPNNPSTPYAVSHAAIDMSLGAFFKQYQFPVILTRFANFYGPHQQLYRIIPRTLIYGLLNKKLSLHGGGTAQRMFIYADDVAAAIHKTIQRGKLGQVYHFSNGPCLSIRNLVEKICDLMKINMSSFVEVTEDRAGKDAQYKMETTKSMTELEWKPRYSLEAGLEKTAEWVQKNLEVIKTLSLNYVHKP